MRIRFVSLFLILVLSFSSITPGLVSLASASAENQYFEVEPAPFSASASGSWVDYDIFTLQGVPKGAVAEIVICNTEDTSQVIGGVRTDGSSLERKVKIHEAESGGFTTATMLVKVDEDTGLIELYAQNDVSYILFYLVGYFTDVSFTELFTVELVIGDGAWETRDLSSHDVPAEAVTQILIGNAMEDAENVGVREVDSILERIVLLHESEPENLGFSFISMMVKTNASAFIEVYAEIPPPFNWIYFYILGYFSSNVDFVEGYTEYNPADDEIWESIEIVEAPEETYNVVSFALIHEDAGKQTYNGLRYLGSSQDRKIWEHEAEGGGWTGFMIHSSPVDRWAEVYCEDASEAHFYYLGYYIIGSLAPPTRDLTPFIPVFPTIAGILFMLLVHDEKRRR